jgi:hypothetical protein
VTERDWQDLNNLRAYLHDFQVVNLVRAHYAWFDNEAPSLLLEEQLRKMEEILDRHERAVRHEVEPERRD